MINIIFKYYGTHNIIKLLKENRKLKIKVRVLNGAVEWALGERGVTAKTIKVHRPKWWIEELKYRARLWENEAAEAERKSKGDSMKPEKAISEAFSILSEYMLDKKNIGNMIEHKVTTESDHGRRLNHEYQYRHILFRGGKKKSWISFGFRVIFSHEK